MCSCKMTKIFFSVLFLRISPSQFERIIQNVHKPSWLCPIDGLRILPPCHGETYPKIIYDIKRWNNNVSVNFSQNRYSRCCLLLGSSKRRQEQREQFGRRRNVSFFVFYSIHERRRCYRLSCWNTSDIQAMYYRRLSYKRKNVRIC